MNNLPHDPRCDGLSETAAADLRAQKLARLEAGDIVAVGREGVMLPFLVTTADDGHVRGRTITTQVALTFDRTSGETTEGESGWRIGVMQPLPSEYHLLMLSLDRRIRLGSNGLTNPLDEGDRRALLYLDEHWARYAI